MGEAETDTEQSIAGSRIEPIYQILDETPLVMRKPLAIVGDHAYAAFWPHVKVIMPADDEQDALEGKQNAAIAKPSRQLCIVRSDGEIYGGGRRPMSDLKFDVALKEIPLDDKLWSPKSAKTFARSELVNCREASNRCDRPLH